MNAIYAAVFAMLSAMNQGNALHTHAEPSSTETRQAPSRVSIDAGAYASADWPEYNRGRLNALDFQGKPLGHEVGVETWLTEKVDLTGKVIVLDFWATWCPPCRSAEPKFHELQKNNEKTLEIVAISGQGEDRGTVESYIAKKEDLNYTHLFDEQQRIYSTLRVRAIPHVVVLSTDGVVRWQGNPHEKAFKRAVEQVIANDPMVKALNEG